MAAHRRDRDALRRELLMAAAKIGSGEIWRNRDAHMSFQCDRDRYGTQVYRIDDADQAAAAEGTDPVIITAYGMPRSMPGIFRDVGGAPVPAPAEPERTSRLQRWREARKTYRAMRAGFMDADAGEIRQLIDQINGAQLLRSDTTEGE